MKKTAVIVVILIMLLSLTACGQKETTAEPAQGSAAAEIANPWRDITEEEAKALCPQSFAAPEGAENVKWTAMDSTADASGVPGPLVQLTYDLDGYSYTAREQLTRDTDADISGMYYEWTHHLDETLNNWADLPCRLSRWIGENEYADLCRWYDEGSGISYSLSVTAKDLEGFDLLAIADAMHAAAEN